MHRAAHHASLDAYVFQLEPVALLAAYQTAADEHGADKLGKARRNGDTLHRQIKDNDRDDIHRNIEHAADDEEIQRALRIADRAQYGRTHVVDHSRDHRHIDDAHIAHGVGHSLLRSIHNAQEPRRGHNAHNGHYNAADGRKNYGGLYTLADVLVVVCAVILRYDDRSAGTQAGEETDDEVQYL